MILRGSSHVILVHNVNTDDISTVPAIDFLFTNDFATFVLERTLQESDFTSPQRCCDPEIGLLVEERHVRDFLSQIEHILCSLVVQNCA